MRHLFSEEGLAELERALRQGCLLAFDYDGTLAPLVEDRRHATMEVRTRKLFAKLCATHPCAVISGRGRDDVMRLLGDARPQFVVGNHGLEPGERLDEFESTARAVRRRLEASLAGERGVEVEDKRYSLSVHFLAAEDREAARARIFEALASVGVPVRVMDGKNVVNVLPPSAPHKGEALLRLRDLARMPMALYVGDDVTDEDVFDLGRHGGLFTVRVGESSSSAAAYFVRDRAEVDALLARLLAQGGPSPG